MPDDDDDDMVSAADPKQGLILALARARSERNKYREEATRLRTEHERAAKEWEAVRAKWESEAAAAKAPREAEAAELARLRSEAAAWADERALLSAGVSDPEGMDFARHAYGRIPEAERPKGGIGEWLKGDKIPKAVAAYLPAKQEAGAGANGAGAKQTATNGGVVQPRGVAPGSITPEAALAQGSWGNSREAIYQSMGIAPPDLAGGLGRKA